MTTSINSKINRSWLIRSGRRLTSCGGGLPDGCLDVDSLCTKDGSDAQSIKQQAGLLLTISVIGVLVSDRMTRVSLMCFASCGASASNVFLGWHGGMANFTQ